MVGSGGTSVPIGRRLALLVPGARGLTASVDKNRKGVLKSVHTHAIVADVVFHTVLFVFFFLRKKLDLSRSDI